MVVREGTKQEGWGAVVKGHLVVVDVYPNPLMECAGFRVP